METQELTLLNRNGKRMPATLRVPSGDSKGLAVVLHGLGGWKDQYVVVAAAQGACDAGFTALTFDASDSARAPDTDFAHSTTTGYVEDLEDVMAYVRTQGLSSGPVVLIGHSLGGTVAATYAGKNPLQVSRVVLLAPAVSWKLYTKAFLPYALWWFVFDAHKTPGPEGVRLPLKRSWLIDFMSYDIRRNWSHISVPVLVVIAGADNFIGTTVALQRFAKGFAQGTSVVIKKANHTFYTRDKEVTDTIKTWLTSS